MKKKYNDDQKQQYRVNERIRFSPVRVIGQDGTQLGTMPVEAAKSKARENGMDLVEVAPQARPPVCRIMDFGKFKYDQGIKEKKQRKNSKTSQAKELKFRPDIAEHDINTKVGHARKFLASGYKVQIKLEYKGRQNAHKDLGFEVINKVVEKLAEDAKPLDKPKLQGRFLTCMLEPLK